MTTVSVIIPAYNHAPYIRTAIESVLNQSFQDLEILVTDDASTDSTWDVVNSISDPRIKLNRFDRNLGGCVAANDCISRSSGRYIAMLSSDDFFLPDKLQKQVQFLERNAHVGAVFGLPHIVDQRGEDLRLGEEHPYSHIFEQPNKTRQEWLRHFFLQGNALCHPTAMVRSSVYQDIGTYDPRLMQLPDLDFWVRLCLRTEIHVMHEKLTAFRMLDDAANMSAPRADSNRRTTWESRHVLRHYKTLTKLELIEIFKDDLLDIADHENLSSIELLAHLALKTPRRPYHLFGLDLWFDFLEQELPQSLAYREFIKATGEFDPYNLNEDALKDMAEEARKALKERDDIAESLRIERSEAEKLRAHTERLQAHADGLQGHADNLTNLLAESARRTAEAQALAASQAHELAQLRESRVMKVLMTYRRLRRKIKSRAF